MKKNQILITIIFGIVTIVSCFIAANNATAQGFTKEEQMMKLLLADDKPITVYGKVIDNSGVPVGGVTVRANVGHAYGTKYIVATTSPDGTFVFTGEIGNLLFIDDFLKSGYVFEFENDNSKRSFSSDEGFVPDQNKPVIYTMRKKLPPTVVVPGEISVVFAKKVKYYEVDLIEMARGKPYALKEYHGDDAHADLKARLEYVTASDAYTFILQTPDVDSGIIDLNQPFYAPPASGYQKEYRVTVPAGQKKETWLYIKSRSGQLYSRLDIKFAVEKGEAYFAANVLTNPLGERNFDTDSEKLREWIRQKAANRKYMAPR